MEQKEQKLLTATCLMAGKIMIEAGSEVYRVEDTMNRIARNAGALDPVSYVTATGIFFSLPEMDSCQIENVAERSINLEKVDAVNRYSRQFAEQKLTLVELHQKISSIETTAPDFPSWWKAVAAGVVSFTLLIMFGGSWFDAPITFFVGAAAYVVRQMVKGAFAISFFSDFAAAFFIGAAAALGVRFQLAHSMDFVIIGAVMPLVPGVAITNSFRDSLAGHLISGLARGTEALITAAAIGAGIAVAIQIFY